MAEETSIQRPHAPRSFAGSGAPPWTRVLGMLLPLLVLGARVAAACTLTWSPVATYSDASPVTGTVRYIVASQATGAPAPVDLLDTDQTTATLFCQPGTYWVTAYLAPDLTTESANSLPVTLATALADGVVFADSAQAPNASLTLANLQPGTGQRSARYAIGSGSQPAQYWWQCSFGLTGTPTPGTMLEIYAFLSNGTHADGSLDTTDAPLPSTQRRNGTLLGFVHSDQTTAGPTLSGSGRAVLPPPYVSLGVWNATPLALQNTATAHRCILSPTPPLLRTKGIP